MENKKIYEAMANVMLDIRGISKDQYNPQQRYKYRGIDDIYDNVQPVLRKHKVFIIANVLEMTREERKSKTGNTLIWTILKVVFSFTTIDGSHADVIMHGEGMDTGDKGINKAMTAAQKYCLIQTFCIPTGELPDSETDSPAIEECSQKGHKPSFNSLSDGDVSPLKNKSVEDKSNIPVQENYKKQPQQSSTDIILEISKDYWNYPKGTKYTEIKRSFRDKEGVWRGLFFLRTKAESCLQDNLGTDKAFYFKAHLEGINNAIKVRENLEKKDIESYKKFKCIELCKIIKKDITIARKQEVLNQIIKKATNNIKKFNSDSKKILYETLSNIEVNLYENKEKMLLAQFILTEFGEDINKQNASGKIEEFKKEEMEEKQNE